MSESVIEVRRSRKSVNEELFAADLNPKRLTNFWRKVTKDGPIPSHRPELGPCWVWNGSGNPNGYGQIGFYGPEKKPSMLAAHRISWIIHNGPIPDKMFVLHKCDNPACVRVAHLFLGTNRENMDDMLAKNRQDSTLTPEQVTEIRSKWANRLTQQKLADEYGISVGALNQAIYGTKTWKHVQPLKSLKATG